jgi:hypothetical protein
MSLSAQLQALIRRLETSKRVVISERGTHRSRIEFLEAFAYDGPNDGVEFIVVYTAKTSLHSDAVPREPVRGGLAMRRKGRPVQQMAAVTGYSLLTQIATS